MNFYNLLPLLALVTLSVTLVERALTLFSMHQHNGTASSFWLLPEVVKSPADSRDYRAIELANQIKVILVSDPNTDKSAASLDVMAGSLHDPNEIPGLAHYLEHFVFLGTERHSGENALDKYLAENGGTYNAHTASGNSWYHFQCAPDGFEGAIDRFAHIFIAPLFTENARESVANAVNSEYEGFLPDDSWRLRRVISSLSDPNHPYSRFKPGNKETLWTRPKELSLDVRSELIKFYRAHYSANVMNLAVIGQESLDQLQEMVEKYFGPIENRHVPLPTWPLSPWGPDQLGSRVDIVPIMDLRHLYLIFPVPDYKPDYKSGVLEYVKNMMEHGGPCCLLALLKRKKWISSLSVDFSSPGRGFADYNMEFTLTPKGLVNIEQIVLHTFQYLNMLRENGPQKWFWDELRTIRATEFLYKEEQQPEELVIELTAQMADHPPEEAWTSRYILSDYKPELIAQLLALLNPHNLIFISQAKQNQNISTSKETYFNVDYTFNKIKPEVIEKWTNCGLHEELRLPPPNEFIPTVFELKPRNNYSGSGNTPQIIFDDPLSRLWFLQDQEILLPRGVIILEMMNPNTSQSAQNGNLQNLFVNLMNDLLIESTYSVSKTGINYFTTSMHSGISLQVQGFDNKIDILFDHVIQFILNFTSNPFIESRFDDIKDMYVRSLKNFKDEEPYHHADHHLRNLLCSQGFSYDEMLLTAQDVTFQQVLFYAKEIFSKVRLQWLIYGNMIAQEALQLSEKTAEKFKRIGAQPMAPSQVPPIPQQLKLPLGSHYLYRVEEETHSQSCVLLYLQTEMRDLREERVILIFMEQMLSEPCFDILRTKEQLGYVAYCSRRQERTAYSGFQIIVQGDKHPNFTQSRIDHFLRFIAVTVNNLTIEEFTKYKDAVRTVIKSEIPKTLSARASAMDLEMEQGTYDFDGDEKDLITLEQINLDQIKTFFNTWINPASTKRKALSIHVVSKKVAGESSVEYFENENEIIQNNSKPPELVSDVPTWKSRLGYFPAPNPYTNIPTWQTS